MPPRRRRRTEVEEGEGGSPAQVGAFATVCNNAVFLAWSATSKIPNCLGFSIFRLDDRGGRVALPAWVGFAGGSNQEWRAHTTETWPIQKFSWCDYSAPHSQAPFWYEIQPVQGSPSNLTPVGSPFVTNKVAFADDYANQKMSAAFNMGILSTQTLSHGLSVDVASVRAAIADPTNPYRKMLSSGAAEALRYLFTQAKQKGGKVHLALFELNDPEMISVISDNRSSVELILSNGADVADENAKVRQQLLSAGVKVYPRLLKNGHFAHNKFVVYVDKKGKAQSVQTGSMNWTTTGLCGQTNNILISNDSNLAAAYYDYWQRIRDAGNDQPVEFRQANAAAGGSVSNTGVEVYGAPSTTQQTKPSRDPPTPVDMGRVQELIMGAKSSIHFLVFNPGKPSIIDYIGAAQEATPGLIVRGVCSDPTPAGAYTSLVHDNAKTADVIKASAINDEFAYWEKELLKLGFAIIHDKLVVIDAYTPNCVVVTGSHNLGFKASYANDDNIIIVSGERLIAQAYATHVNSVYDHYRWRYYANKQQSAGQQPYQGLLPSDGWQDKYFVPGSWSAKQLAFFAQSAATVA